VRGDQRLLRKFYSLYFYFSLAAVPVVYFMRCEDAFYLPKFMIISGGLVYLPAVISDFFRKRPAPVEIAAIAFLGWVFITALKPAAYSASPSILMRCLEWLGAASYFFYAARFMEKRDRRKVSSAVMISAAIVCAAALLQSADFTARGWLTDFSGRAFSTLGNPDFLGGFIVIAAPVIFSLAAGGDRAAPWVFTVLAIVLALSQTRSSMAAFALGTVLLVIFFPAHMKKNMPLFIAGALAAAALFYFSGRSGAFFGRVASAASASNPDMSGRIAMWKAALKMIHTGFLTGIGPGMVKDRLCMFMGGGGYFETDFLHNDFLQIFAESGVIAAVSFYVCIILVLRRLFREHDIFSLGVFAGISALCVQAFFNFPFYVPETKLYFFSLAGLAFSGSTEAGKPGKASFSAGALVMAAVFIFFTRLIIMSSYLNYGINSMNSAAGAASGDLLKKAGAVSDDRRVDFYEGQLALGRGDFKTALEKTGKTFEFTPCSKPAAINAAIAASQMGSYGESLKYLDDFLYYYPSDVDALCDRGKVLFISGKTAEAVDTYMQAVTLAPWNETAHDNLYAILKAAGRTAGAKAEEDRWKQKN
jgi:O-antigen ligase